MILYRNNKGKEITAHSYSAGLLWSCARKYKHLKLDGWASREDRVQLTFGTVVEAALVFWENNNREKDLGWQEFQRLWSHYEHDTSILYSAKTGGWEDCLKVGTELLKLYEVTAPSLPIGENPQFQVNYRKELFPDTEYAGLEWQGFIDVLTEVEYDHPLLPPLDYIPENGKRKLVIDIKTSANPYFEDARLIKLDGQLRQYAWASEIETQAFLVLVKNKSGISAGETVRTLRDFPILPAGSEVFVLTSNENNVIIVKDKTLYEKYVTERDEIKGTGSKAKKDELLTDYVLKHGITIPLEYVTKQKIQFLAAIIPKEDQLEAGALVGREAIEISEAFQNDFFPKKPGVRFPNQTCISCDALGLCLNDKDLIRQRLIKIDGTF